MTKRELNSIVKSWQNRLDLQDWKIRAHWKPKSEMLEDDGGYCMGKVLYSPEYGSADIYVLRELDREEGDGIEDDIVHELLHILLEGHKAPGPYDARFERALNVLARELTCGG